MEGGGTGDAVHSTDRSREDILSRPLYWEAATNGLLDVDPKVVHTVRELGAKACKTPLSTSEAQTFCQHIRSSPRMVHESGISPKTLSNVIVKNPNVAVELFLALLDSPQLNDCLNVLVAMKLSLHSLDVVNKLTTRTKDLPTDFLHNYISSCMSGCSALDDKYHRTRAVRLVCVFLQSLIRNKNVAVQDMAYEIQAFCLEFSEIKEAVTLFRLLKALDGDVSTSSAAATASSSDASAPDADGQMS